jgi:hypothetical protein
MIYVSKEKNVKYESDDCSGGGGGDRADIQQ